MTASLLVFVPVALFFIVAGFCFVGCGLDTRGHGYVPGDDSKPPEEPKQLTTYSDTDVLGNLAIVAYWPLNEPADTLGMHPAIAHDIAGAKKMNAQDGRYVNVDNQLDTFPPGTALFPCPNFEIAATLHSETAKGGQTLGVTGMVAGDAAQPADDPNVLTTAMQVDGGFVTVPFASIINPDQFTVEAWVSPEWDAAFVATRALVDSRTVVNGAIQGFVLWVNDAGNWQAVLNTDTADSLFVTANAPAVFNPTYVALTFDGTDAALYIDGALASDPASLKPGSKFVPNSAGSLIIAAGMPWLPPRPTGGGDSFFPLLPFKGTIQDVAIYNVALNESEIESHFFHGTGKEVPEG